MKQIEMIVQPTREFWFKEPKLKHAINIKMNTE